jgi:hypothetical protein
MTLMMMIDDAVRIVCVPKQRRESAREPTENGRARISHVGSCHADGLDGIHKGGSCERILERADKLRASRRNECCILGRLDTPCATVRRHAADSHEQTHIATRCKGSVCRG